MKRLLSTLIIVLIATPSVSADDYPRNTAIDITHYAFELKLTDDSDLINGVAVVHVRFTTGGVTDFNLDLIGIRPGNEKTGMTVTAVECGGVPQEFEQANNRLRISLSTPPRAQERRRYTITYSGIPEDGLIISENRYGERTFFGDNWPDRCRFWLPTVDHPYDKATCEFIVTAPERYQVVANGVQIEESNVSGGGRLTHWKESVPIPTYCMVIGVARFAVQHSGAYNCIPIQTWVYPQDREAGFFDFARSRRVIEFYSQYVGPYPYEKLANVQSKTRYGGMENASAIFYSERSVTGQRHNENTITHEIAHQWFGDSVTEADWHHIWLSEGFATYFTHLFNEFTYGHDRLISGLQRDRERIIDFCRQNPAAPVIDTTITDLNRLLSVNSYQKGSWVLHMLRSHLGDELFRKGIREYFRRFCNGTAMTFNLQQVMEDISGEELGVFFNQWLFHPGIPYFKGFWDYNEVTGIATVELEQAQPIDYVFRLPLEIAIYPAAGTVPRIEVIQIKNRKHTFTVDLPRAPEAVILDPNTRTLMQADFSRRK